jgi:hypothetical protein
MRVLYHSANLGAFDHYRPPVPQDLPAGVELGACVWTDETFPPRSCAMTPRLQARIPKLFGWQMNPGYDVYCWLDASFTFTRPDCLAWWLGQLGEADLALCRHPHRTSIREEADFVRAKLMAGSRYIHKRYAGELLEQQMGEILADTAYVDDRLFATTILLYRPTEAVTALMQAWWYHTSRYHVIDQLALPWLLSRAGHGLTLKVIDQDIYHSDYMTLIRRTH